MNMKAKSKFNTLLTMTITVIPASNKIHKSQRKQWLIISTAQTCSTSIWSILSTETADIHGVTTT